MLAIKRAFCVVIVVCLSTFSWAATNSCKFKRGDSDGNGTVQITDAQHLWNYAYQGGPAPPNKDAADANDDGYIDGNDSSFITLYLFSGGAAPPDPGPVTADCDPTTSDTKEESCTPVGAWTITSATAVPSTILGWSAFDCNTWGVQFDPRKIRMSVENSEETEAAACGGVPTDVLTGNPCCARAHAPCVHNDTRTRWTFAWNVGSSPAVERLAFNTGCTKLRVTLDWRAKFVIPATACHNLDSTCHSGDDLLSWIPEDVKARLHFKNQTTQATSIQEVTWFTSEAQMATFSVSHPVGGVPCPGLTEEAGPQTNAKHIDLSTVTWSGDHQWKLEKIEVKFIATFFKSGQDNADIERIEEHVTDWSVYLATVEYQNL